MFDWLASLLPTFDCDSLAALPPAASYSTAGVGGTSAQPSLTTSQAWSSDETPAGLLLQCDAAFAAELCPITDAVGFDPFEPGIVRRQQLLRMAFVVSAN